VNEFMEHCACSGEWVGTVRREDVVGKLEVMGRVAAFYGLRMLGDVVGGCGGGFVRVFQMLYPRRLVGGMEAFRIWCLHPPLHHWTGVGKPLFHGSRD